MPTTNNIRENTRSLWRHLSVLDAVLAPIRDQYDYVLVDSHPDINDLLYYSHMILSLKKVG